MDRVSIVEVGPRDGFQAVKPFIPTQTKIALARKLADSGLRRIEIGSFVSPTALPQMSDIRDLLAAMRGDSRIELSVLVPNLRGAELALASGVDNLVYVISASQSHNQSNVRRSVEASLDEMRTLLRDLKPQGRFRFNLATAFDCPFEGTTPPERVLDIVAQALEMAPQAEVCLCDTTGKAIPVQVAELFRACAERFGPRAWAYHAHDTYGLGLASSLAAYQEGVRVFDAAVGGLGGCPFAPGATGNIATEDLVFLFETSGLSTGVALGPLIEAASLAETLEGGQTGGHIRIVRARRAMTRDGQKLAADPLLDA